MCVCVNIFTIYLFLYQTNITSQIQQQYNIVSRAPIYLSIKGFKIVRLLAFCRSLIQLLTFNFTFWLYHFDDDDLDFVELLLPSHSFFCISLKCFFVLECCFWKCLNTHTHLSLSSSFPFLKVSGLLCSSLLLLPPLQKIIELDNNHWAFYYYYYIYILHNGYWTMCDFGTSVCVCICQDRFFRWIDE